MAKQRHVGAPYGNKNAAGKHTGRSKKKGAAGLAPVGGHKSRYGHGIGGGGIPFKINSKGQRVSVLKPLSRRKR